MQAQNLAVVKGLVSVAWADGHVSAYAYDALRMLTDLYVAEGIQ